MKKIFFILCLLLSGFVHSETIELSCKFDPIYIKGVSKPVIREMNLTINYNSKNNYQVYVNDKNLNSQTELGIQKVTSVEITNSDIKIKYNYFSFKKSYPNGVVIEEGESDTSYDISRTTGRITEYEIGRGGMKELVSLGSDNNTGTSFKSGICEKRRQNKF